MTKKFKELKPGDEFSLKLGEEMGVCKKLNTILQKPMMAEHNPANAVMLKDGNLLWVEDWVACIVNDKVENKKNKVFIIGSKLTEGPEIEAAVAYYKALGYEVRCEDEIEYNAKLNHIHCIRMSGLIYHCDLVVVVGGKDDLLTEESKYLWTYATVLHIDTLWWHIKLDTNMYK